MKKWMFTVGFVAVGALVGTSYLAKNSLEISNSELTGSDIEQDVSHSMDKSQTVSTQQLSSTSNQTSSNDLLNTDSFVSELIAKLKNSYEDSIHLLHIQASLIQVKEFVLQRYPSEGDSLFASIIRTAFPSHADSILALLSNLDIYNEWLIDNQTELLSMEQQIQQGMMWEKRREIFGADAEKIWAHELSGMNQQQNAMQQVIHNLNQAHDISMDEKLFQLQTAISEQFDGSVQNTLVTGGVISKVFFTLDSVQQELASMDANSRQEKINDIRMQLGLDDEQLSRLQKRDQEREERWNNGLAYMAEREQLLASADEYTQTDALQALREQYFGADAITIQREEESDFWRYKRPRIYGVN